MTLLQLKEGDMLLILHTDKTFPNKTPIAHTIRLKIKNTNSWKLNIFLQKKLASKKIGSP